MKIIQILPLVAILFAVIGVGAHAADTCYPNPGHPLTCGTCPPSGYDRSPVPVIVERPGAAPVCVPVDPWSQCGTFCEAGQLPAGWPYGWRSDYWLRPDSNF